MARKLNKNNVKALAIHGDKSQNSRQTALSRFKSGEIDVLVATDIAARGIDIIELPVVINYNVPEEPETYIHRIGRTGRAGQEGVAITFCCSDELESFRDILKLIGRDVEEKRCEWSVTDMVPTKPERRQQNGRGNQPSAPEKKTEQPKAPAEPKPAPKQEKRKKQQSEQPKRETSAKAQPAEQKKPPKSQTQAPKQEKREDVAAPTPIRSERKEASRLPKREKPQKQQAPKQESAKKEEGRRETPKQQTPPIDRRYTESGEHDGATGQQIVTNFNRSVWLEFNEPPKKPKKMWQTPITQMKTNESRAADRSQKAEDKPATTEKSAERKRRFPHRRGKDRR